MSSVGPAIAKRIEAQWRRGLGVRQAIVNIARHDHVQLSFDQVQPVFAALANGRAP